LGSADLMPRNLNRRVEVDFPVQDKSLIRVLRDEILGTYLKDTAKARHMNSDGKYVRDPDFQKTDALNSQEILIERASKRQDVAPAARARQTAHAAVSAKIALEAAMRY
jgi:polyphosphate kinase